MTAHYPSFSNGFKWFIRPYTFFIACICIYLLSMCILYYIYIHAYTHAHTHTLMYTSLDDIPELTISTMTLAFETTIPSATPQVPQKACISLLRPVWLESGGQSCSGMTCRPVDLSWCRLEDLWVSSNYLRKGFTPISNEFQEFWFLCFLKVLTSSTPNNVFG